MTDLELAETDELIDELRKRFDALLVLGSRDETRDGERVRIFHRYQDMAGCVGLAMMFVNSYTAGMMQRPPANHEDPT